jgi:hypothetical protein
MHRSRRASLNGGGPNPEATLKSRLVRKLRDPWWQGAGALLAAASLGVALAAVAIDEDRAESKPDATPSPTHTVERTEPSPAASTSSASTRQPTTTAPPAGDSVNCSNGDGDHNTNNCNIGAPSPDGAADFILGKTQWAWFDGDVEQLAPPRNGQTRVSLCNRWDDWLTDTPDLYLVGPKFSVTLTGNSSATAVITDVAADLYQRRPMKPDGTLVKCEYMGGDANYYYVIVNTITGKTSFVESEDGHPATDIKPVPMPPGLITLNRSGYTSAEIFLDSKIGQMYEGSLRVTVMINGKKRTISIGSPDNPLRWATPPSVEQGPQLPSYVGWNGKSRRWTTNYSPTEEEVY